jgi:hypothetical protein
MSCALGTCEHRAELPRRRVQQKVLHNLDLLLDADFLLDTRPMGHRL